MQKKQYMERKNIGVYGSSDCHASGTDTSIWSLILVRTVFLWEV